MDAFLFQATLYLLAMIVAVPIASRLGLGSVLGYLLAGIVIGPVTGLVGSEVTDLQHFAEFGVVMMMFLIGLELEPRALWAMRHKLVGLGGLQVLGTLGLIAVLLLAFGAAWEVALAAGTILSLSSTAIVLQTLDEKHLMQTAGGRSAFAVLLTQDIAVIPMLALLPLLAVAGLQAPAEGDHAAFLQSLPGWGVTLVTLAAVGAVILAGHYLIRPAFHFVQGAKLREINTALALAIVVTIASLMLLVGLSPALGTFLAGVVLANSEFRHELESDIAPFKGLLLGLFFITVGAGIDMDLLLAQPVRLLALTLGLMAVKGAVLFLLGTVFGVRGRDRWLFTLALAQAGEFGFVLISFTAQQRILPEATAQLLMMVVALSMLLTPLVFILYDQLSRRMTEEEPEADEIDEAQPIIIAGIGRFGQVVNRMVTTTGLKTTVIDHDLNTIRLMRRFGFHGYFGDPTRPELLKAAGIDSAKILVVCLDEPAATTELVAYARRIRPDLHIIARARDRVHVYALYKAGADDIVREVFDSSLRAARYVLENSGLSEYEAAEAERIFFKLDRAAVRRLAEVWDPALPLEQNPAYIQRAQELNRDLEAALTEHFEAPKAAAAREMAGE
ncbi:monovalent cation:proton antiporter-2 (CPA2) family protein [Frigidibacter sp. MR17.24]|uniref:monovalent cation:proton antiporter-2 (CPA2) family protein n=1 Tax=Frigidibacter sp. MR17.24 TaxID=3127345 RepID=UPI003012F9E2